MLEQTVHEPPSVTDGGPAGPAAPREGGEGPRRGPGHDPARFGLWAFLGTVAMLFMGFTSAYLVRRESLDWRPLAPPALLWVNTAVLAASSAALVPARRALRGWSLGGARRWLGVTGFLGGGFLLGQVGAWRLLRGQGVFLASNPHSSFFYMLTGVHAAHLLGGLIWFAVAWWRLRRLALTPGTDALGLFATYWHFLGVLWLYLLVLLFVV
jgi:cytochrome c oxidase subunit 3